MDDKYHEMDKRIDLLEERMNTKQAESESALDRLRADMAKRENRIVYAVFGAVGLATVILGVLIITR